MSNLRTRPQGICCILNNNPAWSPAEDAALRKHYPTGTHAEVLAALPGRTLHGAQLRAAELNVKRHRFWTPTRLRYLLKHYPTQGAAFVAAHVGCARAQVTKKASLLRLPRHYAPKPTPTPKPPKAVKTPPAPKPQPQPKPVPEPVAQHQPARLNNLIAQKSLQKKKKTASADRAVSVAYIKSLPYQHPEAHQYRMGGERAVLAYRAQQRG